MQSLWMLLACVMFATMGACIKTASDYGASLPQIVLFRGVPSVVLLLAWAHFSGRRLAPANWKIHIWRNVSGISSMWLGFYALSHLPLATAVSLNYTSPLFIAGWLLARSSSARDALRTLAVILGFLGVIGVLRPSIGQDQFFVGIVGLCAGALTAVAMMQIKQIGQTGEAEWRTVLIFSVFVCFSSLVGLLAFGWRPLDRTAWFALMGLGSSGLVGQLAMTRAFGQGSTLLTAALQYTTIIFATLLGMAFWGDRPDPAAWAGMALIISSGLLATWRTYTEKKQRSVDRSPRASARKTS